MFRELAIEKDLITQNDKSINFEEVKQPIISVESAIHMTVSNSPDLKQGPPSITINQPEDLLILSGRHEKYVEVSGGHRTSHIQIQKFFNEEKDVDKKIKPK